MVITIDELVFSGGLEHATTKWLVQEYLDNALVKEVSVPFGTNRVTLPYNEYSGNSSYYITTTRKLNDGTILDPVTDIKSFIHPNPEIPSELVTPKIYKPSLLTLNITSDEVVLTSSVLEPFIGQHIHMSSSWTVRDSSGSVLFSKPRSIDDKTSISIPADRIANSGIITVEVIYHTEDNKKSFKGMGDFNLTPIKYDNFIKLYTGDDTNELNIGVINYVKFLKLPVCEDTYTVRVIDQLNNVLLEQVTTNEIFELSLNNVLPGTLVTVEVTGKYKGDFNVTRGIPKGSKQYVAVNKSIKSVDLDANNITKNIVSTINPSFTLNGCTTIELADDTIPIFNTTNNTLEFFYIGQAGLIKANNQVITLDTNTITILPNGKIKLIDNSILVVCYNQINNTTSVKSTVFRMYSVVVSGNYNTKFNLIHSETIPHYKTMTDAQAEIYFGYKENFIINWTYEVDKLTKSFNFTYDGSILTPKGYTNLEAVTDMSINSGVYDNILTKLFSPITISKVVGNTISNTLDLGNVGEGIIITTKDNILYTLTTVGTTVELNQIK